MKSQKINLDKELAFLRNENLLLKDQIKDLSTRLKANYDSTSNQKHPFTDLQIELDREKAKEEILLREKELRNIAIKEQIRLQAELEEVLKIISVFNNHYSDGFFMINNEGYIVEWSIGMEKITGKSSQTVLQKEIWAVFFQMFSEESKDEEHYQLLKQNFLGYLNGSKLCFNSDAMEIVKENSDLINIRIFYSNFNTNDSNKLICFVRQTSLDVDTQINEMKSMVHISTFFDNSNLPVLVFNNKNKVEYYNSKSKHFFEEYLNIKIQKHDDFAGLFAIYPDLKKTIQDLVQQAITSQEVTHELIFKDKFLQNTYFSFQFFPQKMVKRVKNVLLCIINTSHMGQSAIHNEEISQNSCKKISNIINKQLTELVTKTAIFTKYINNLKAKDVRLEDMIENFDSSLKNLIYILETLHLNEAEDLTINPQMVNLVEFIHDLIEKQGQKLKDFDYKVEISIHAEDKLVNIDISYFELVFSSIFCNAVIHSKAKKPIKCSVKQLKNSIDCEISDQGNGMSEEEIKHIFIPFYKGEFATNQNQGANLFVVKSIMQKIGGNIHVESKPGRGTIVLTRFPV